MLNSLFMNENQLNQKDKHTSEPAFKCLIIDPNAPKPCKRTMKILKSYRLHNKNLWRTTPHKLAIVDREPKAL